MKSGFTTRQSYDQAQRQLRTQQAAVKSAKAAVSTAEEQLGYADDLKPGVTEIITARNAETGQVVQAGQTVFTVAQDGPRDAVFDVYEALLADPPDRRQILLQADPNVAVTGTVRENSPTVDAASDTVKLKVGLDSVPEASRSKPLSLASAPSAASAVVLPRSALFRWQNSPAVWPLIRKSRTVRRRSSASSVTPGDQLVLSDGVAPGDQVVTAGIQFLRPGQIVGIAKKEPSP